MAKEAKRVLDRLSLAGWISAFVLGAWAVYELVRQAPNPVAPAPTENSTQTRVELPELEVVPIELDDLRTTLDRPLFSVSRRPEEMAADTGLSTPTEPVPVGAPPLRLSAVIVDAQSRSALLEPVDTKVVQRIQEGEEIAGWRLVEVREDAVILAAGGNRSKLALRVFDAPPPPRPTPARRATRSGQKLTPSRKPGSVQSQAQASARVARERAARLEQARRARRDKN